MIVSPFWASHFCSIFMFSFMLLASQIVLRLEEVCKMCSKVLYHYFYFYLKYTFIIAFSYASSFVNYSS